MAEVIQQYQDLFDVLAQVGLKCGTAVEATVSKLRAHLDKTSHAHHAAARIAFEYALTEIRGILDFLPLNRLPKPMQPIDLLPTRPGFVCCSDHCDKAFDSRQALVAHQIGAHNKLGPHRPAEVQSWTASGTEIWRAHQERPEEPDEPQPEGSQPPSSPASSSAVVPASADSSVRELVLFAPRRDLVPLSPRVMVPVAPATSPLVVATAAAKRHAQTIEKAATAWVRAMIAVFVGILVTTVNLHHSRQPHQGYHPNI
ncbi:hypothetical protein OC834_007591, partial [Tilletia horrida]